MELASVTSPGPRWRIDRPFATPYTTVLTLITALPDGTFTPYQKIWQEEYVDSLRSKRPKFYIVDNPAVPHNEPTTLDLLYKLPGLKQWLQEDYRTDTIIGNYVLFEHVSESTELPFCPMNDFASGVSEGGFAPCFCF